MTKEDFRATLNSLMSSQDRTQEDIARHLGVANSTVSHWCLGKSIPRGNTLVMLADYFGVSPFTFTLRNTPSVSSILLNEEEAMLRCFREMNKEGREKAMKEIMELSQTYYVT